MKTNSLLWSLIRYTFFWSVWLEWINLVFNNKPFHTSSAGDLYLVRIFWWLKSWRGDFPYRSIQLAMDFENVRIGLPQKVGVSQGWLPPQGKRVNFNVNGLALSQPRQSRIRGILRDHNNNVLEYFSKAIGLL